MAQLRETYDDDDDDDDLPYHISAHVFTRLCDDTESRDATAPGLQLR